MKCKIHNKEYAECGYMPHEPYKLPKIIDWYSKIFYKIYLPILGNKKIIYTVTGASWWAYYASDTKRWVFNKSNL